MNKKRETPGHQRRDKACAVAKTPGGQHPHAPALGVDRVEWEIAQLEGRLRETLPLNIKYCLPGSVAGAQGLLVGIGRKHDQPMEQAYRLKFGYRVMARTANYLQVNLEADEGPLDTRDYRIVLAATPADDGRTLIRLSYSYSYGMAGRLAMEAYLRTLGRDKVGITVVGRLANGQPRHVGGMRGAVERNSMRYYLAIEAFLGAQASPAPSRVEKSVRDWFAVSERHPRQ